MIVVESLHHINIQAGDVKTSTEFYTMFLDFELVAEEESSSLVRFDNVTLKLHNFGGEIDNENPVISFILDVDDFTEALQEIESREVEIITGPNETEKGERVVIKDPAGNLIELFYEE